MASGGFIILPSLLDSSLVKSEICLLSWSCSLFVKLLNLSGNKREDVSQVLCNNKLLTRLNIILLEIFSDENNLENEKISELLEKILDLVIKFTEVKLD
jgi:hypothetical protein